jgi:ADP-heptose:LPS heptosyltransferase
MFSITQTFAYISLLGLVSQSLCTPNDTIERRQATVSDDVPTDAKKLPLDCQDSLYYAGMTAEFKASKAYTDEYFVQLKLSAGAKDVTDVLATMAGVKAIQTYTREDDRGFSAKLSYEQVCALDKDARVSYS